MGCGKTYWGKIWAEKNNLLFYDLDHRIEQAEGETVDAIFEKKGESYFRKIESVMLRSTVDYDNCIISCGGGTPCFEDNISWMNKHGITVFIKSTPRQIFDNILRESKNRPLIKNLHQSEWLAYIEEKLSERNEYYMKSTFIIESQKLNNNSLDDLISKKQKI